MRIGRHTPYLGRSHSLTPHATEKKVCPDCDTLDVFRSSDRAFECLADEEVNTFPWGRAVGSHLGFRRLGCRYLSYRRLDCRGVSYRSV